MPSSHDPAIAFLPLFFHHFKNRTVYSFIYLLTLQSYKSAIKYITIGHECHVKTSMPSSHDPVITMFHCLFIILKFSLFSMPSCCDPVVGMFRCFFIILKISLFSMPSSHDPAIAFLFISLKISLFSMSSSHDPVIAFIFISLKISLFSMPSGMFHCFFPSF
jgi:hypothetical protein